MVKGADVQQPKKKKSSSISSLTLYCLEKLLHNAFPEPQIPDLEMGVPTSTSQSMMVA